MEITDAVQYCIDAGTKFHVHTFDDGVLDLSSREDISSVVGKLGKMKVTYRLQVDYSLPVLECNLL